MARGKRGGDCVEVGKGEEMRISVIVPTIKLKNKKYLKKQNKKGSKTSIHERVNKDIKRCLISLAI